MKDKQNKKTTIEDVVKQQADKERKQSGKIWVGSSGSDTEVPIIKKQEPVINDAALLKEEKEKNEYNEKITELDPLYTVLSPVSKILVRCKVLVPYRSDGGLIMKPSVMVPIRTGNEIGWLDAKESPWPYSREAIIVALPEGYKERGVYKVGQIVQLTDGPVRARPTKGGEDAEIILPSGYAHPLWKDAMFPQKVTDRHYGYILVNPSEIEMILPEDYDKID